MVMDPRHRMSCISWYVESRPRIPVCFLTVLSSASVTRRLTQRGNGTSQGLAAAAIAMSRSEGSLRMEYSQGAKARKGEPEFLHASPQPATELSDFGQVT